MRRLLGENTLDSKPVTAQAKQWVSGLTSSQTLAVFSPLHDEVDITSLVTEHPHHQWVFPRVDGDHLTFHVIRDPQKELHTGAYDLLEPALGSQEISVENIDVFFCPGLAFDPSGGRIGRGRGFYDRILAHARPNSHKIGVCFSIQLVPNTFPEDHDIKMDEVINGVV